MGKLNLGKLGLKPDPGGHVKGVNQGNALGAYDRSKGHNIDGTSTSERSTGINPDDAGPIDPRMPNLSPA